MKWKDFKQAVEDRGVNDSTEIDWISYHSATDRSVVVSISYGGKIVIQDSEFFASGSFGKGPTNDSTVFLKRQAD
jgi:hypothetical protein